jgi:iron(III) transport system ATP-binding protein
LYFNPSSKFVADFLGGGSYLPATRISEYKFHTALGTVEAIAKNSIAVNQDCELLLRPQQVQIEADRESSIRVQEQHFMGDHCRYVVHINGNKLTASSSQALTIGQSVCVNIDEQGILAF